ncbi:MAG: gamma-glutamyltransferase [Henriciella sp.]|nr:gamma-glutamyltransferase [Henriciella sp.]
MRQTSAPKQGIVTSPHFLASRAGLSVLKDGGNAVEAAVTVAATLAVVYPHMTGIGGDSFWLVRSPAGEIFCVDACGAAAEAADLDLYASAGLKHIPFRGPLAANTVAGTISGWEQVLRRAGGSLSLARLLRDAIQLARDGVPVTKSGASVAAGKDGELAGFSGYAATFRPDQRPLQEGDILRQPKLAETLERLIANGLSDYYTGEIAADIASDLAEIGSPVSAADLAAHKAQESTPLSVRAFGAELYNFAPPTQGFASLLILALFERLKVSQGEGFEHVHGLVEATKQAFATYKQIELGDPSLMLRDAQEALNDTGLIDDLVADIDPAKARIWPEPTQGGDTTWFGAMDAAGWSVSAIQSTYFEFGSGIVLPKTGITWQNRGASFVLADSGWNALKPGRKPFHTLNPAMALFDDGRTMVYGTMGGEGQPQTQAAIFTRYAAYGMDLQAAVSAPRWLLGRTWGETSTSLKLENRFDPALIDALKEAGHDVEILPDFSETMGHAGALVRHPDGGFIGASDPRSDGEASAW